MLINCIPPGGNSNNHQEQIQFDLAEAASLALYNNNKKIQLSNDVSKILHEEQSIKAPLMQMMIRDQVKWEINQMTSKITTLQQKHTKAVQASILYKNKPQKIQGQQ